MIDFFIIYKRGPSALDCGLLFTGFDFYGEPKWRAYPSGYPRSVILFPSHELAAEVNAKLENPGVVTTLTKL